MEKNIKCLVLSGGGIKLYSQIGIIKSLIEKKIINIKDIESIYCTSAGCMLSIPLILGLDIDIISNYYIKRPWDQLFKIDIFNILYSFTSCALINKELLHEAFLPLFNACGIDIDIDLETLYNITNKEIHIYTTNITDGVATDISYLTHPKWKVIDTIHSTMNIPLLFEPLIIENKCYLDGGLLSNFPLNYVPDKYDKSEICGVCFNFNYRKISENKGNNLEFFNLIDYLQYILINGFKRMVKPLHELKTDINEYPYIYNLDMDNGVTITSIINIFSDKDKRQELFEIGQKYINELLE